VGVVGGPSSAELVDVVSETAGDVATYPDFTYNEFEVSVSYVCKGTAAHNGCSGKPPFTRR